MVVLDEFYEISERETENVSPKWKAIHITLFIIIAISGFLTTFEFGQILNDFDNYCIIGADITFLIPEGAPQYEETDDINPPPPVIIMDDNQTFIDANNPNHNSSDSGNTTSILDNSVTNTISGPQIQSNVTDNDKFRKDAPWTIDLTHSVWGTAEGCQFVQFTPITSMISAIVWGTFYVIMARGGAGYPNDFIGTPWRVIYPCMAFSLVFSIILAINNWITSNGIEGFCSQFYREFGQKTCSALIDLHTRQFHPEKSEVGRFYRQYRTVIISAYISLIAWATQLGFLIFRVFSVVDFKIHHVKVSEKEEEFVQQVIEFHDDAPAIEEVSQV